MPKDSSIPISPKHGINPTMGICLYCGEETGEIGLLGRLKGDEEAPRYSILSYEPCKECANGMKLGVAFIAVTKKAKIQGQPSIKENQELYPTGEFIVIRPESQICVDNGWSAGQRVLCEYELFKKLIEDGGPPTLKKATYVSVWDGGLEVESSCLVDMKTGEVTDIGTVSVNELDNCEEEYVLIDGKKFEVQTDTNDFDYYVDLKNDEQE